MPARFSRSLSGTARNDRANRALLAELAAPCPIPSSALYSRSDGVCAWQVCREKPGAQRENIEVFGSHCGLGVNPSVIFAVADRLAQTEGQWTPFAPRGWASWAYPAPGTCLSGSGRHARRDLLRPPVWPDIARPTTCAGSIMPRCCTGGMGARSALPKAVSRPRAFRARGARGAFSRSECPHGAGVRAQR